MISEYPKPKELSPETVRTKVRGLAKLSTLPFVAMRVMELVENPKTSASQLVELISTDQVLAARILKLANSAYYGFPRKISTLNLAIVVLGFNALRDLVLSISIIDRFWGDKKNELDLEQFWRHVLTVGRGAKLLAKYLNYPIVGEVFVAGLLHDIGYMIMLQQFPDDFIKVFAAAKEQKEDFHTLEDRLLSYNHQQLGAWLAEGWNLPPKLVESIKYHHRPERSINHKELTTIVYLADLISASIGADSGLNFSEALTYEFLEETLALHAPKSSYTVSFFQERFREEVAKIDSFLGLVH